MSKEEERDTYARFYIEGASTVPPEYSPLKFENCVTYVYMYTVIEESKTLFFLMLSF